MFQLLKDTCIKYNVLNSIKQGHSFNCNHTFIFSGFIYATDPSISVRIFDCTNIEKEQQMRWLTCLLRAIVVATAGGVNEIPPPRQPNWQRQRGPKGQNLLEDYFLERPIFSEADFRRRYRMSSNLFTCIKTKLCQHDDYWHQRRMG